MEAARRVEYHRGASATSRAALTRAPRVSAPRVPDIERVADRIVERLEQKASSDSAEVADTLRRIESDVRELRGVVDRHDGKLKSLGDELFFMQTVAGSAATVAERVSKDAKEQVANVGGEVGAAAAGAVAEVLNGKVIFDPKRAMSWSTFKWAMGAAGAFLTFDKIITPLFSAGLALAKRAIEHAIGHPMGPDP